MNLCALHAPSSQLRTHSARFCVAAVFGWPQATSHRRTPNRDKLCTINSLPPSLWGLLTSFSLMAARTHSARSGQQPPQPMDFPASRNLVMGCLAQGENFHCQLLPSPIYFFLHPFNVKHKNWLSFVLFTILMKSAWTATISLRCFPDIETEEEEFACCCEGFVTLFCHCVFFCWDWMSRRAALFCLYCKHEAGGSRAVGSFSIKTENGK